MTIESVAGRFWAGGFPRAGDPIEGGTFAMFVRECLGFTWPLADAQPSFTVIDTAGIERRIHPTSTPHIWRAERRKDQP